METKQFNDIPTGWYTAKIDGEEVLCYKFVKPEYKAEGKTHWHFMNIMREEVLRLATCDQLLDGIIFTPIYFVENNDVDDAIMLVSEKEMA